MKWRDIKTAPKDGTGFLGYWPYYEHILHNKGVFNTRWTEWGGGMWEGAELGRPVSEPTHWMPNPDGPETSS